MDRCDICNVPLDKANYYGTAPVPDDTLTLRKVCVACANSIISSPEFKAEKLWADIKRKVDKSLARYNMLGEPRKDAIRMVYVYLPSVIYNQLALPDFIQKKMNESGYYIENRPSMTKVQIHISHYEPLEDGE